MTTKTPAQVAADTVSTMSGDTLLALIAKGVTADRAARSAASAARATHIVFENYGPDANPEVFSEAVSLAGAADLVDTKHLLNAAIVAGHLDGDGIFAMLREAAR